MTSANKTYIVGGLVLVLAGLIFGVYYAIFDEHQTLVAMGTAFAQSFFEAAGGNETGVAENIETFRANSYEYMREVSVHAHIIELGTLALIVPLFSHRIGWSDGRKLLIARLFIAGSLVFCLGVFSQIFVLSVLTEALAVIGSGLVIVCVGVLVLGLFR
jgi:hypothetical protein